MGSTIEIKGTYKQKTEIFGHVVSHHEGTFDVTKPLSGASWSQHFGPATLTLGVDAGKATVSVSAFGQSVTVYGHGVVGHNKFKMELDSGNVVQGTVALAKGEDA